MRSMVLICGAALLLLPSGTPRGQDRLFTIVARGSLNTTGRLFPNPNATDPVARAVSDSYSDYFGAGAEFQYHIPNSNLTLGLAAEYVRNSGTSVATSSQRIIDIEDGYHIIPVEFTGYFRIPVTEGDFSIVMGGGVGIYWGSRHYAMAGVEAPTTATHAGYGIHVLSGVGYRFNEWCTAFADIKFRDAQFQTSNAFQVAKVRYGNTTVNLPQQPFDSSIHSDGMVFQIGFGVSF
jgi:hypothetical protein